MNIAEVHKTVIEHSPFAYSYQRLLLDSDGNAFDYEVLDLNAAFEQLIGRARDEVVGARAGEIGLQIPGADLDLLEVFADAARRETGSDRTFAIAHSSRWYRMRLHVPAAEHVVALIWDLMLERGGAEKLRELDSERERAREAEASALETQRNFVSNVSHELRTPLNAVMGFSDLLISTYLTPVQRQYSENINAAVRTLMDVVNDILDYSRSEAGTLQLHYAETDLLELVERSGEALRIAAHQKGLELIVNLGLDTPRIVETDGVRLEQVLTNLLSNAVKFTLDGEVELCVFVEEIDYERDTGVFTFSVRDTGIGIDDATRTKLFRAFSQADSSATRRYGGVGLGLTIASTLLKQMGTALEFESSSGAGSLFWFSLSLSFLRRESKLHIGELVSQHEFCALSPAIVVDGNERTRSVLQTILEAWGVEVDLAPDGRSAVAKFNGERPYRLMVVDAECAPGLAETAQRLTPRPVMLELRRAQRDPAAASQSGGTVASVALVKPVRITEFAEAMRSVAARSLRSEEAGSSEAQSGETMEVEVSRRACSVLIAEDDALSALLCRRLVSKFLPMATLHQAADGEAAVRLYELERPEVILMDIQMPERDGYSAARAIRAIAEERDRVQPMIVAVTARTFDDEQQRCLDAGMDFYIPKPINFRTLRSVLAHRFRAP